MTLKVLKAKTISPSMKERRVFRNSCKTCGSFYLQDHGQRHKLAQERLILLMKPARIFRG
jgi:hypothetical protein